MQTAIVIATIEYDDQRVEYKTFRAPLPISRLKRLIVQTWRKKPGVVHVACGNGIYQNSYGAH